MKTLLFSAATVALLGFAGQALAQAAPAPTASAMPSADAPVGKKAGTFMVRARLIAVVPEDNTSSTSVGGHLTTTTTPAPEVDVTYFFTDHFAAELIAATTEHHIRATATAVGDLPVGSTWVLPPTVTLQYHFAPHARFSPYVGAGVNATLFYATHADGPTVTRLSLPGAFGEAVQVGADYNIRGHWFLNVDVKQIFLNAKAHLNTVVGPVSAKTSLDPLVIGAGVGYRF